MNQGQRTKRRVWMLGVLVLVIVAARCRRREPGCPLAAAWTAGDVHRYEVLTLSRDKTGRWALNSYDDDIAPASKRLTWTATSAHLTVTADGERRRVPYSIERVGQRCRLDATDPVPGSYERTWYTGGL